MALRGLLRSGDPPRLLRLSPSSRRWPPDPGRPGRERSAARARAKHTLFESIRTLFAGRTVLLVSYGFSSVLSADKIFVLAGGRFVEQGTHAELMDARELSAELFTLQAEAYRD